MHKNGNIKVCNLQAARFYQKYIFYDNFYKAVSLKPGGVGTSLFIFYCRLYSTVFYSIYHIFIDNFFISIVK